MKRASNDWKVPYFLSHQPRPDAFILATPRRPTDLGSFYLLSFPPPLLLSLPFHVFGYFFWCPERRFDGRRPRRTRSHKNDTHTFFFISSLVRIVFDWSLLTSMMGLEVKRVCCCVSGRRCGKDRCAIGIRLLQSLRYYYTYYPCPR